MHEKNIHESDSPANVTGDREACSKYWIATYVRPQSGKKTAPGLSKLGVETYVPIQRQLRNWSDRKKMVDVLIISMIVFAYITEADIHLMRHHPLVNGMVSETGHNIPAPIPSPRIEMLHYMLGLSDIPVSFRQEEFRSEDIVTNVRGSLKGLTGQVKAVKDVMTE